MKKIICTLVLAIISTGVFADAPDAFVIGDPNCRIENPNPRQHERATWSGACKEGYADGDGILQWYFDDKPSSRYEGGMAHGLPNGTGVYVYASNIRYEGGFANGKMNGQGVLTKPDGYKLVATFENNKVVGIADVLYANGASYKGMYENGRQEGQGRMVYTDGYIYDGEWKDGKRNGHGILTGPNGYKLVATFEDDNAQGEVELHYSTDAWYAGMYKNGQREGNGRMTYRDGAIYFGEWKRGKRDGHGHLENVDGTFYDGDFKSDLYDGKGVLKFSDGRKYEGNFKNGVFETANSLVELTDMSKEEIQVQLKVVDERINGQLTAFTNCQNSNAYLMSRSADVIVDLRRVSSISSHLDIQEPLKNLFATYKSMGGLADDPVTVEKIADPCKEFGDRLKSDIDAEAALQKLTPKLSKESDTSFKRAVIDFAGCNRPDYPRISLYLKQEGTVRVTFLIGAYGLVNYAFISRSSGARVLDDVAREALSKCHFVAGSRNGQPVSTWTNVDYVFKLPI